MAPQFSQAPFLYFVAVFELGSAAAPLSYLNDPVSKVLFVVPKRDEITDIDIYIVSHSQKQAETDDM